MATNSVQITPYWTEGDSVTLLDMCIWLKTTHIKLTHPIREKGKGRGTSPLIHSRKNCEGPAIPSSHLPLSPPFPCSLLIPSFLFPAKKWPFEIQLRSLGMVNQFFYHWLISVTDFNDWPSSILATSLPTCAVNLLNAMGTGTDSTRVPGSGPAQNSSCEGPQWLGSYRKLSKIQLIFKKFHGILGAITTSDQSRISPKPHWRSLQHSPDSLAVFLMAK